MKRDIQQSTRYAWEGRDRNGQRVKGTVKASNTALLTATLRRRGISVTRVRAQSTPVAWRPHAIKARELAVFTRQFATMLQAGLPLLQALSISAQGQANTAMAALIRQLHHDIATGSSLAAALSRFPRQFGALACHLVAAGEQSGTLDILLERLASHQEKAVALNGRLRAAMVYPAAIVAIAVIVTTVLLTWVVPAFAQVYASLGTALPMPTLVVLAISGFITRHALAIGTLLALSIGALRYGWRNSPGLHERVERALLRLPLAGALAQRAATARWSRTLATMSAAGIPLMECFAAVGGASANVRFREATELVRMEVGNGSSLSQALRDTNLFPDLMLQLVQVGEQSGTLDAMLDKVATIYEREVDQMVGSLSTLLEPLVMVILGVLIGALVLALYLPVFSMGSAL